MSTKLFTFADAARVIGCKARDISDLVYSRHLDETQLIQVGNRRVIPDSYLPIVREVLKDRNKIRSELVVDR